MAKSPGHQTHPNHKVIEHRVGKPMKAEVNGEVVAESRDVIRVDEDGAPPRFYFPRGDVRMGHLVRTQTTTRCPYKGTANYYSVRTNGRTLDDAIWTYEEPYDEHAALKERLAFYEGKFPEVHVIPAM